MPKVERPDRDGEFVMPPAIVVVRYATCRRRNVLSRRREPQLLKDPFGRKLSLRSSDFLDTWANEPMKNALCLSRSVACTNALGVPRSNARFGLGKIVFRFGASDR